ncbi:QueG-associated DUF1730 domain-containing protein, partial [Armatimonas sp.]|uniref:QueG-associated DUF1730 domain-containing protein n=1 Tax=Armatimonas sp. TaxID=1872638 RepID=UPI00374D1FDC
MKQTVRDHSDQNGVAGEPAAAKAASGHPNLMGGTPFVAELARLSSPAAPTGGIRETVREYALTLFDEVGFTSPAAPGHTAFVDAWLEAGYHGEMSYLKTRKRLRGGPLNSQKLLGKARSVIVVAQSYDFRAGAGQIARYARGADYHQVMWDKLNTLRDWLADEFPGTVSRGYTDSGPIRER